MGHRPCGLRRRKTGTAAGSLAPPWLRSAKLQRIRAVGALPLVSARPKPLPWLSSLVASFGRSAAHLLDRSSNAASLHRISRPSPRPRPPRVASFRQSTAYPPSALPRLPLRTDCSSCLTRTPQRLGSVKLQHIRPIDTSSLVSARPGALAPLPGPVASFCRSAPYLLDRSSDVSRLHRTCHTVGFVSPKYNVSAASLPRLPYARVMSSCLARTPHGVVSSKRIALAPARL